MRLLLACDPLLPVPPKGYGGIERIVDDLVRCFKDQGHEVALLAKQGSTSPAHRLFAWPDDRVHGAVSLIRNTRAIRHAVKSHQPDVVHSFARLVYLLGLTDMRTPRLMSYQRHAGGRGVAAVARWSGERLNFTGCSEFICGQGRRAGGTWWAVPNFVDTRRYTFVPRVADDAPLVFLSRVEDIKGPDTAIAIARASGRRLLIAGNAPLSGAQRDFFEKAVAPHLGRDGVEWIGELDDEGKNRLLGSAAALLVPIRWEEPFGIVFAEALACGTPVISCPLGALPEIIHEGKTGFLIPSDNVEAGVNAVKRLAELDRAACRQDAEKRFDLRVVAARYMEIYQRMQAL